MPARTALQALSLRPKEFLGSSWPWRSLAYLLSGSLLGVAFVAAVVLLLATGVVLAVVLVGALAFLAVALAGTVVARVERWRLRLVDAEPLPDWHRPPPAPGVRPWVVTRLREPATWRELGYASVSAVALWWMDLLVAGAALYVPLSLLAGPFFITSEPLALTVPAAGFGLLLAAVAAYPVTAWAGARAAMTRTILTPPEEAAQARLVEVTRSRARLVDAFEVERRRIERDLHDGAQQRLVALTMHLGIARLELPTGSPAAAPVEAAHEQATLALAELRELIRGVHPKVLTDRGLAAAVGELAGRSPVPVDVAVDVPRLPSAVEVTAYFVVAEALANVAKHAQATRAAVTARVDDTAPLGAPPDVAGSAAGRLVVEVRDDGVGGADPGAGTGLTGLVDRVAALGGTVALSSPHGGPTLIRVTIPCLPCEP